MRAECKLHRGHDRAESERRMSRVQRVKKLEYEQRSLCSFNYHFVVLQHCPKPCDSRVPMNINIWGDTCQSFCLWLAAFIFHSVWEVRNDVVISLSTQGRGGTLRKTSEACWVVKYLMWVLSSVSCQKGLNLLILLKWVWPWLALLKFHWLHYCLICYVTFTQSLYLGTSKK